MATAPKQTRIDVPGEWFDEPVTRTMTMEINEALSEAIHRDDLTTASAALEKGADPNHKDDASNGRTPLHLAAGGDGRAVKLLLDHGADPQAQDWSDGKTPLYLATEDENDAHLEAVEALLKGGADPNVQSAEGNTPLHNAAERGRMEVVQVLLDRGADPQAQDANGKTPLHLATEVHHDAHHEAVEVLLKGGANPNVQDDFGRTPLHSAAFFGSPKALDALLDYGADISMTDGEEQTALHKAADQQSSEAVKLLLDRGADPQARDWNGQIPEDLSEDPEVEGTFKVARETTALRATLHEVEPDQEPAPARVRRRM